MYASSSSSLNTPLASGSITDYLEVLASKASAPGGGSAAALTAAQGAALLGMVVRLTLGKPKYARHEDELRAILAETDSLRATCTALIDRDAAVLRTLIAAYALPRGTVEEQAARAATLQGRLREATEAPLSGARAAVALPPLCRQLLPIGNPATVSDIGVSAACAGAAFRSAELNVLINLGQIDDSAYVEAVRGELGVLGAGLEREIEALLDEVRAHL